MLTGYILAAGLSRRMINPAGQRLNKLLLDIDGQPMVRRVVQAYLYHIQDIVIVTGHDAPKLKAALDGLPVQFLHNSNYTAGQNSSLKVAVDHAVSRSNITGQGRAMLVSVADIPLITPDDIGWMIDKFVAYDACKIIQPTAHVHNAGQGYNVGQSLNTGQSHNSGRGHPVIFPHEFLPILQQNLPQKSGKSIIDAHADQTIWVECDHSRHHRDVDIFQIWQSLTSETDQ